ncbi:hypothetical protein BGZ72_004060 [Mortierella alpina]|nr:hypothetical protein BGZ72_004060 [Mortierella alpina]
MENIMATLWALDAAAKQALLTQTQTQTQTETEAATIPLPLSPSRPASSLSSTSPTPPVPGIQDTRGLKPTSSTLTAAAVHDLEHAADSHGRAHDSDVSQAGTRSNRLDIYGQTAEYTPCLDQPAVRRPTTGHRSLPTPTGGWEYHAKSHHSTEDSVEPSWMNQAETLGWDSSASRGGFQSRGRDELSLVPQSSSVSSWQKADDTLSKEYIQVDFSKQASALFHYHTRQYLEAVTTSDPMVDIRLVFTAHHLPRGDDFVNLLGPLRVKHMVDTYVIPHEFASVDEDSDVVLGLSGTISRVCDALEGLLQSLASQSGGLALWLLYLLVPCPISHLLVGVHDWELGDDMHRGVVESLVPSFQKVMGRLYGPISVAQDECIFSVQSCNLSTIMEAVMLVGEICSQEEAAVGSCSHFYRGGHPSVLPKEVVHHTPDLLLMSTAMDPKVPAGYLLRPEMRNCIKDLQKTRHHLQLTMLTADAQLLAEEQDTTLRNHLGPLGACVRISDPISIQDDVYRVCDVGVDGRTALVMAVMEVVRWMVRKSLAGWSIKVYIPERVVAALKSPGAVSSWRSQGIDFDVKPSVAFRGQGSGTSVALEPAEQESVLLVSQSAAVDIENAVRQVVTMIYD